jgi:hypothetical protein
MSCWKHLFTIEAQRWIVKGFILNDMLMLLAVLIPITGAIAE